MGEGKVPYSCVTFSELRSHFLSFSSLPLSLQLRNHLLQAQRYQNQPYSLKFDNPDTIQTLVDVRFEQLECSISVDLWQVCVCVCGYGWGGGGFVYPLVTNDVIYSFAELIFVLIVHFADVTKGTCTHGVSTCVSRSMGECSLLPDPLQRGKEGLVNIVHPHTMG